LLRFSYVSSRFRLILFNNGSVNINKIFAQIPIIKNNTKKINPCQASFKSSTSENGLPTCEEIELSGYLSLRLIPGGNRAEAIEFLLAHQEFRIV